MFLREVSRTERRIAIIGTVVLLAFAVITGLIVAKSRHQIRVGQSRAEKLAVAISKSDAHRNSWLKRPVPKFDITQAAAYRTALDHATDIKAAFTAGDTKWSATVLAIESLFFAREERRACGESLGADMSGVCDYDINMAIVRIGQGAGTIVDTDGKAVTSTDLCREYAACIAQGRVGKAIPIPAGAEAILGITQRLQATKPNPQLNDPDFLERQANTMRLALARYRKEAQPGIVAEHQIQRESEYIRYVEYKIAELRGQAGRMP